MSDKLLTLFCLVDGEATSNAFPVKIEPTETIGDLKKAIKTEKAPELDDIAADKLTLWRASIPNDRLHGPITVLALDDKTELTTPRTQLRILFPESPDDSTYIIVKRPPPGRPGTPLTGEKWHELVERIESDFLGPASVNYTNLAKLIKAGVNVTTIQGSLGGLPFVLARASYTTDNRPSLMFLNLPESPEAQHPLSTADMALERLRGRSIPLLPLFGVSGCGKTRTTIEMLSKNWGFYFNASGTDLGSGDLHVFLELAQQRRQYQNRDMSSNTHLHILSLALVLARVIILHNCLNIAEHEGAAFTCKHWMLLQVGFRTMGVGDLFAILFSELANAIHHHCMDVTVMAAFAQERFSSLHDRLVKHNTTSQSLDYKILVVIDEAQNLGKHEFGAFLSQQTPSDADRGAGAGALNNYMRSILSPFVHGLYRIATDKNTFCVVPCGTGLSIFDMKWLEDSAPGPKGYHEQLRPFTDFQGWESPAQVQRYINVVREALPNTDARNVFDIRVPNESVPELFKRLRGRFRPIVSAIERMIAPRNGRIDWRLAIKETEDSLSSTEDRYQGKGNIVFDIWRMIRRVHKFESRYAKYQNIHTTLKAFVLEHYLHGRPLLLNKEEVTLVEASVGRILNFSERPVTVLDEPFALRATVNYFRRIDPDFHSAICSLLGSGSNPSVHGHQWEMAVLPSLAHVFHDKILSKTGLVRKGSTSYDRILDGKAEIVGYANHLTFGTDSETMTLDAFLRAHVHHGSQKDGNPVPPFYHPAETLTGPDVVFVLHFDNHGCCPVFVQLKMRHKMTKLGTQLAFSTVKSEAVQGHLHEAMLDTFCTGSPKRFLGVVVAYPAELAGVEGTFPEVRRSERIGAVQGDIPQCISLRIDMNNIHQLFPENHMKALDILKGVKRQLETNVRDKDSGDQKEEPATKHRRCDDDSGDTQMDLS